MSTKPIATERTEKDKVTDEVVAELKSLTKLPDVALAQVLSYLKAAGLRRALLINFVEKRLVDGIKRVSL